MNIYLAEIRNELKRILINLAVFFVFLILTLILVKILDDNMGLIAKINASFEKAPEMLRDAFSYLRSEDLSVQMKAFLMFITVYSFPILFYAMISPMYSFEKEEETGTICFLYDNPITRKEIIVYKYIMGLVNYAINIIAMFILSTFLVLVSYSDGSAKGKVFLQMFNIWSSLFIVGVIFLTIGVFFSASKRKEDDTVTFALGFFLITNIIGLIPYILQFVSIMLSNSGRNVENFLNVTQKLSILKYISFAYWCNPVVVYDNSMDIAFILLSLAIIVLFYILAVYSYKKREFGE